MAIETTIKATIRADVDKKSFGDGVQFARDTGKKIDQELKSKYELDIAQAQIKLKTLREELKKATSEQQKIDIIVDINSTQRGLTETKRGLNNLLNTGEATTSRLQSKFTQVTDTIKGQFTGALNTAGGLLASLGVATGLTGFIGQIISLASATEKYNAILKNALGSQTEATESLTLLKEIASQTPFSLDEITQSYIKLVNRGFKPTRDEIIKIGDLAASQGKSFDQLTEAILDAQTGEFERLKEFGVKAKQSGDEVTFSFRGVSTTVNKTEKDIQNYLLSLGEIEGIQGSLAVQSATLGGQISNLGDTLQVFGAELGTVIAPFVSQVISLIVQGVEVFKGWGLTIGIVSTALGGFSVALGFATGGLSLIIPAVLGLVGALGFLSSGIDSLGSSGLPTFIQDINNQLSGLEAQIKSLNEAYDAGKISTEDYTNQLNILLNKQAEVEAQANTLNAVNNELNRSYIDAQAQIASNNKEITSLTKKMTLYTDKTEQGRAKIAETQAQIDKYIDANKELGKVQEVQIKTQNDVNNAIDSLNVASSVEEFKKLQFAALATIKSYAQVLIAQLAIERKAGNTKEIEKTIAAINKLKEAAISVGSQKFSVGPDNKKDKPSGGSSKVDKAEKEAKELQKIEEKALKDRETLLEKEKGLLEDLANAEKENAKQIYDDKLKQIEKVNDAIKKIDDDIAKTRASIADLEAGQTETVAQRVVTIQNQLQDQGTDPTERIKLEQELALAIANTTQEEIAKQKAISEESKTETILRETAEKKAQLEQQLADQLLAKQTEVANLATLNEQKALLEANYTTQFKASILERETAQIQSINRIKSALQDLYQEQVRLGITPTNATTNNQNNNNNQKTINNTFVVNSQLDINQAVNTVSSL